MVSGLKPILWISRSIHSSVVNSLLADPVLAMLNPSQLKVAVEAAKKKMEEAAAELDFLRAARFRDEMNALKRLLEKS